MRGNADAEGVIFNIQKFSVNDGPGIRTVVFVKGCPLRCAWCANPESQSSRPELLWDARRCLRCGHCAQVCPREALALRADRVAIDRSRCVACGACARECPSEALKIEGERVSVREALRVVMQDLPFYEESGGGLTVSGGELLTQPDFSRNLLLAAKEVGLRTCCETTGMADAAVFASVTEAADLILFDVKHWNGAAHRRDTGLDNALPLQNLEAALQAGKAVLPRIPVIPGFNDAPADADGLAALLVRLGAPRCQLLPFHQFGESKYALLDRPYALRDIPALRPEDLEGYRERFLKKGVEAFF